MKPEMLLEELRTLLSFDRPVAKEKMVEQTRDLMLEAGFPVGNDLRLLGSSLALREMAHRVRTLGPPRGRE